MKRNLKEFLYPNSIAIIGASETEGKVGYYLTKKALKSKSKIILINKKQKEIQGKKTYSSILKYPKKIDLVVIAIPKEHVLNIINQCIKKKIKNIIIISAGFEEDKNSDLAEKLKKKIAKNNLNILGPNCFGITNLELNLDLTFSNKTPKKGSTAFISQSGALYSYLADLNIKIGKYVSLGNMSDLSFTDWIEFLNKDKKTKKIVCYIEKLKEGRKFIDICKKSKKKIIVLKAGQTEEGKKATFSHTGSLATDHKIYGDIFKQAGVIQKNSLLESFGKRSKRLSKYLMQHKKIKIITNAGGASAILADKLTKKGFKISKIIDLLGTAQAKEYEKEINKTSNENIIVILTPQSMSQPKETAIAIANSKNKKRIIPIFLGKSSIKPALKVLKKHKISYFSNPL